MKLPLAPEAETVVYSATGYLRAVTELALECRHFG